MKKVITLILTLSLLLCPLGVSAAEPEIKTAYAHAKLLNFGEFPEKPEYEVGIATASIPQYNSAAGATAVAEENTLQEIHEYLRDCMINCEQKISLENYKNKYSFTVIDTGKKDEGGKTIYACETLKKIFTETVNYYPELFNVSNEYQYTHKITDNVDIAYSLIPKYVNPDNRSQTYLDQATAKAAYDTALKKYNDEIDHIIGGIAPEMSDLEKALYVHDYLITHFQYDLRLYSTDPSEKAKKVHDVYGFFNQRVGVCQAYTQTFNAIMHRLGIKCTSAINDTEEHTWNIITLDGKNYHIDATQDDTLYKLDANTYVNQSDGFANHNFFLLSNNTIKNTTFHSDWYSAMYDTSCTDQTYESGYAWNVADSPFEYVDGKWYYIDYDTSATDDWYSQLFSTVNFKDRTKILDIDMCSSEGIYYSPYYGGLTSFGNILYFTTPFSVFSYNTFNGTSDTLLSDSTGTINSCRYDGTEENGWFSLTVFHGNYLQISDLPSSTKTLAIIGDTDGNEIVNSTDIVNTKKYLLGSKTDFNWATIDFGNKKQVSILDLVKIKKIAS